MSARGYQTRGYHTRGYYPSPAGGGATTHEAAASFGLSAGNTQSAAAVYLAAITSALSAGHTSAAAAVLEASAAVGLSTTVNLSGGTVGSTYTVACKITTSAGNIDERTFVVNVVQR